LKNLAFLVGSGFCPILSQRERRDGARRAPPFGGGRPRAMLTPDAGGGKAKTYSSTAGCIVFEKQVIALVSKVWFN